MDRIQKDFVFQYPLKHKVVRDLKIVTEHVGDLIITGVGYFNPAANPVDVFDRYAVDVRRIDWNGTDIRSVLEVTGSLDELEEAAVRYFAKEIDKQLPLKNDVQ